MGRGIGDGVGRRFRCLSWRGQGRRRFGFLVHILFLRRCSISAAYRSNLFVTLMLVIISQFSESGVMPTENVDLRRASDGISTRRLASRLISPRLHGEFVHVKEFSAGTPFTTNEMSKPFLRSYGGQTIQQLIAMKESHRIDSLVLAVEQALAGKPKAELSEAEVVVLAVEALEREVTNGGYEQFFRNSSGEFTALIVPSLESIGCPKVAAITAEAIATLALPEKFVPDIVKHVASRISGEGRAKLGACDSRYYKNDESIEQRLFLYIERRQQEIQIPHLA
jgi:hypothetical protein